MNGGQGIPLQASFQIVDTDHSYHFTFFIQIWKVFFANIRLSFYKWKLRSCSTILSWGGEFNTNPHGHRLQEALDINITHMIKSQDKGAVCKWLSENLHPTGVEVSCSYSIMFPTEMLHHLPSRQEQSRAIPGYGSHDLSKSNLQSQQDTAARKNMGTHQHCLCREQVCWFGRWLGHFQSTDQNLTYCSLAKLSWKFYKPWHKVSSLLLTMVIMKKKYYFPCLF